MGVRSQGAAEGISGGLQTGGRSVCWTGVMFWRLLRRGEERLFGCWVEDGAREFGCMTAFFSFFASNFPERQVLVTEGLCAGCLQAWFGGTFEYW